MVSCEPLGEKIGQPLGGTLSGWFYLGRGQGRVRGDGEQWLEAEERRKDFG